MKGNREMIKKAVSVLDHGAVPNGSLLQTAAFQAAIDACFLSGGGVVEIPEGTYTIGSIRLRSNVTLHLLKNAILVGSRNPEDYFGYLQDSVEPLDSSMITDGPWNRAERSVEKDYRFMRIPGSRWNNALIRAINAENICIIGEEGSVIDGCDCFDELGEENYRGPHGIGLFYCKNIVFKGYTVQNSGNWAHSLFYCENILVKDVTVLAGHDGIHLTVCKNIDIRSCHFYTGDDCIGGFANVNVTVKECEMNSACSALRFGGTNVLVENCHMFGPCRYLFRGKLTKEERRMSAPSVDGYKKNLNCVFTYYSDYSVSIDHQPGNIIIRDCKIENAERLLYFNFSGNAMWQTNRPLQSIHFENLTVTGLSVPVTAYGEQETPVSLSMKNVDVTMKEEGESIEFMRAGNYDTIRLDHLTVRNFTGKALIKTWSDGSILLNDISCGADFDNYIEKAAEAFDSKPY